jgi:hypothetical protein
MDLSSILSGGKLTKPEHYWALVIEPGWIQAGVWEISNEKAKVISLSPPAAWEVDEEIIGAADTALSSAIQKLPEDIGEPSKTVFGVPSSWVGDGQIKAENLERIKKICAELSLEPTGFVVIPEAIAHLIKSEEGAPLNAIVVGIGDENIEIAVFKLGNLIGNSTVARSVSIADDVIEGLARFSGTDTLPSRILLYDGKEGELEEEKQTLLKLSWDEQEKVKFLHTPKIEIVDPDRKVLATVLAGASEIGNVTAVEGTKKEEYEEEESVPEETQNIKTPDENISPEELGFSVGADVSQQKPRVEEPMITPVAPINTLPALPETPKVKAGLMKFFTGISSKIPSTINFSSGKRVFIIAPIVAAILLIAGFLYWTFVPKATVTIYVATKKLEEKIALNIDPNKTTAEIDKGLIPGQIVTAEVQGDKTKSTTGTKTIGEKAKGTVKIQNGTASNINLAVGVLLVSTNDLKFAVTAAASVSAALSPSQPGTANVDVAAIDIGAQYNLAKDETFKVGNYPKAEVDAVAVADFSGGSSRDISAVSIEDQKALEDELTNELLDKAKIKITEGLSLDKYFVEETLTPKVDSKAFSSKVGDEASTLKLTLGLTTSGVTVDKQALLGFAKETLKEKIPSGYVVRDEQITFSFDLIDNKSGIYKTDATMGINLLPEINTDEIAKNISGKNTDVATQYLTAIPGFTQAEVKIKPQFPGRLGVLPRIAKNITIEVSSEK